MKVFELGGELRTDLGKKASKALRNEEKIPCVLYGCGNANTNFVVNQSSVRKLIYTPDIFEVKLILGGKKYRAVIKEVQFHPVTDKILHMDFLEVDDVKPIVFKVPVKTEGLAVGVRAGGDDFQVADARDFFGGHRHVLQRLFQVGEGVARLVVFHCLRVIRIDGYSYRFGIQQKRRGKESGQAQ